MMQAQLPAPAFVHMARMYKTNEGERIDRNNEVVGRLQERAAALADQQDGRGSGVGAAGGYRRCGPSQGCRQHPRPQGVRRRWRRQGEPSLSTKSKSDVLAGLQCVLCHVSAVSVMLLQQTNCRSAVSTVSKCVHAIICAGAGAGLGFRTGRGRCGAGGRGGGAVGAALPPHVQHVKALDRC